LNGARIPCEIQTFKEDVKNKLMSHCNSQQQIFIPFSSTNFYMGKNQYTVDSIISHPDFIINPHQVYKCLKSVKSLIRSLINVIYGLSSQIFLSNCQC